MDRNPLRRVTDLEARALRLSWEILDAAPARCLDPREPIQTDPAHSLWVTAVGKAWQTCRALEALAEHHRAPAADVGDRVAIEVPAALAG